MKVISRGHNETMIIEVSRYELEALTGKKVYVGTYCDDGIKLDQFVGKEFGLDKWKETLRTAESVRYRAKDAVESLDRLKKLLETATFPFFDSYQESEDE